MTYETLLPLDELFDYSEYSIDDLREIARFGGVPNYENLTKAQLLEEIKLRDL